MVTDKPTPLQLFRSLVNPKATLYMVRGADGQIRLYVIRNGQNMAIHQLIPQEALAHIKMERGTNGLRFTQDTPPAHPDLWIGTQLGRAIYDCEFSVHNL